LEICSSSSLLRVKIVEGQLTPFLLPDILFSENALDQNNEIAILFTVVKRAYTNGSRVGKTFQNPGTRVVS